MSLRGIYWFPLLLFAYVQSSSQIIINDFTYGRKKIPEYRPYWLFGLGWNAVDDNSNAFKKLFDFRNSWNIPAYPSQLWAERTRGGAISYGLIFNFNMYKPGKLVHGKPLTGVSLFFSLDAFAKYHLNAHLPIPEAFDVYIPFGVGGTLRFVPPHLITPTFNTGGGLNWWLNDWLALNFQSTAKFGLKSPIFRSSSNYLQHSAGFVIRPSKLLHRRFPFVKPRYPWVHRKKVGRERIK